jgi:hypothetical protein
LKPPLVIEVPRPKAVPPRVVVVCVAVLAKPRATLKLPPPLVVTRPRPSAVPPTVVVFCQDEPEPVLAAWSVRAACRGRRRSGPSRRTGSRHTSRRVLDDPRLRVADNSAQPASGPLANSGLNIKGLTLRLTDQGKTLMSTTATTDPEKPLCFVIGPIGGDGTDVRKHADWLLLGLVKHVLEADEFRYFVKRADEAARPGMITDLVIHDIYAAKLVVADFTGLNPNALYELGICHVAEKPVIHIAAEGTKLPFDHLGNSTIFVDVSDYRKVEVARKHLAAAAREVDKQGFRVSNPITQANASFKMAGSADPRDRVIAEMQSQLQRVENELQQITLFRAQELYALERLARRDPYSEAANTQSVLRQISARLAPLPPIAGLGPGPGMADPFNSGIAAAAPSVPKSSDPYHS